MLPEKRRRKDDAEAKCNLGSLRGRIITIVRVKASITFPADLLQRIDRIDSNRSAFLESAALLYLARLDNPAGIAGTSRSSTVTPAA